MAMTASFSTSVSFGHQALKTNTCARAGRLRNVSVNAFMVRPYTTRKGDTLQSIADKRGFEIDELQKLNHQVSDPSSLDEGITILVPASQLSERDRDIISGIGRFSYRTYPVRKGEKIEDIMSKRGITMAEMEKMNPDVNLEKLKENQILKLPAGKYTVREQEMLTGVAGVPAEFFQSKGFFVSATILGIAAIGSLVAFFREKSGDE